MSTRPSRSLEALPLLAIQEHIASTLQRSSSLLTEGAGATAMTARIIEGSERLSPLEQLDIYREQFWLRHVGSLRDDFPSLVHVLGADRFEVLARAYLEAHPPATFTLRDLGDTLEGFTARTSPWKDDLLLADICRLEWAFIEAFDAPDAPTLDAASLSSAPEEAWETARIAFQPSMRRLTLSHPVHELRAKVRNGEPAERPAPRLVHVVVYRAGLGYAGATAEYGTLQYVEIEPVAHALLEVLARRTPLATACEQVATSSGASDPGELGTRVGEWFRQWAAFGWVSRVDFA